LRPYTPQFVKYPTIFLPPVGGAVVTGGVVGGAVVGPVVVGTGVVGVVPPAHEAPLMVQFSGGLAPLPIMPQEKEAPAASGPAQDFGVAT
jgi:hypothetical protein